MRLNLYYMVNKGGIGRGSGNFFPPPANRFNLLKYKGFQDYPNG